MYCTYKGFFEETHRAKKRRMIGPVREKAIETLIENNKSSEMFREMEANRLMKTGMFEIIIF